jgi:hypothetical protein
LGLGGGLGCIYKEVVQGSFLGVMEFFCMLVVVVSTQIHIHVETWNYMLKIDFTVLILKLKIFIRNV